MNSQTNRDLFHLLTLFISETAVIHITVCDCVAELSGCDVVYVVV